MAVSSVDASPPGTDGNASRPATAQGAVKPNLESPSSPNRRSASATGPGASVSIAVRSTYDADEPVSITLTGTQSRLYSVYVYDANGTAVVRESHQLDARSEELSFGRLDPGSYRVVVVETYTGDKVGSVFGVGRAHEPGIVPEVVVDEPADPVQIPMSMPNGTDRVTVRLQQPDGEYDVRATVVDADGDGRVRLEWNTFYAGRGGVALRANGTDAVVNASRATDLSNFLPETEYHLSVLRNGSRVDRGAIVLELEPLHTTQIGVFEAPAVGSPMASFAERTESSSVETDEWAFVVVRTEGVFGAVNSTEDLRSIGPDQVMLTIEPDDGTPVNLRDADYVDVDTDRILVGFAPGNDALTVNTSYDVLFQVSAAHPYRGGEERTGANLNVVPAGSEPDHPEVTIASVTAPRAVAADAPANFTVTLVNQGDRRGTVPVSVTIGGHTANASVSVPGNGRASTTVTFDTSRVLPGNRTYEVRANDTRVTGTIQIGDGDAAEPTLVQGDRGSGSALPGFGVGVAVLAILVALAVRIRTGRA